MTVVRMPTLLWFDVESRYEACWIKIKRNNGTCHLVGAIKKVMMTNTEENVIELYRKKTPITKIVATTGVSLVGIYKILSDFIFLFIVDKRCSDEQ